VSVLPEAGLVSFARGVPSPDMFPLDLLADCAVRAIEQHGRVALNYGPPAGYEPLRAWIAERHGVDPERVLVTPGSLIGLNLVVRRLCAGGATAIVEAPTYDRMLHALADAGAAVAQVGRADDGIDLDRLTALARNRPALVYVLPTFHNPTGRTLDEAQRRALVDVAVAHDLVVFEDDPYGLLRIEGTRPPSLLSLFEAAERPDLVIHASSFSKSVAPGLRAGYLIVPEPLQARLAADIQRLYVSPPLMPQAQLYEFLAGGHLEPHLATLADFLRPRRDALLAALERLGDGARWTRPEGGYFLWLELAQPIDATRLAVRAHERGVAFVPGAGFYAADPVASSARLSFSYPAVDEIAVGADRLVDLILEEAR
jgi:DNA-binding transcriptional MocR family regulator